jgi:hypothetical protein
MPSRPVAVFINCPFDPEYLPLFRMIVFTVQRCGFEPRCALEVVDSAETRISKIQSIIAECRLGIHDISRTELNPRGLPRFNMPFELGLFMGAKRFGSGVQKSKRCLVLDREPYRYQKFLSDIAGQDVDSHDNDLVVLSRKVRDFLDNANGGHPMPSGTAIEQDHRELELALPTICGRLELDLSELTFKNYVWITAEFLEEKYSA